MDTYSLTAVITDEITKALSLKMLFTVGITEGNIRRGGSTRKVVYKRRVRANRREALRKCLPDIRRVVLPQADTDILYISVYVGQTGSVTGGAARLTPIQITRRGTLR